MSKTILVTGGAGAIGSSLVSQLHQQGNKVIVLDNLSSGRVENIKQSENVIFIQGSVDSDEDLDRVFGYPIEVVFHLAANFANQNSVDFPQRDLQINGVGTLKLLLKAQEQQVKRFVYTSSSCVYGNRDEALSEKCKEYSLDTPYAVTKLLGESYCNFFYEHHKFPVVVLRYFNVYGPSEFPGRYRNVIPNFFYKAMRNEEIFITGTGKETRDFNFVDDSVRGTILASEVDAALGKTFNIASGIETTVEEVVDGIMKLTQSKSKITKIPRRDWDTVTRRVADASAAKEVLGYEPQVKLEDGLSRFYEWLKAQDFDKCKW